jgi:hypothetical protein
VNLYRIPIRGWNKCLHEAAAFEGQGEYATATILDASAVVSWWFRNDPPLLRIPTPIGYLEPDFLYLASRDDEQIFGVIEVKGGIFWDGEGSEPRVKAEAAGRWVEAINATPGAQSHWEFAVVLDTDALNSGSLEELRRNALFVNPSEPA